jgi:hypothetical protein
MSLEVLKVLNLAFMLFCRRARFESTEIAPLAGARIDFPGVQTIFARTELADHGLALMAVPEARTAAGSNLFQGVAAVVVLARDRRRTCLLSG